jgi:dihydroorotate dehydrogenase
MFWQRIARPLLFCLPAESAHHLAMDVFSTVTRPRWIWKWCRRRSENSDSRMAMNLFGLRFENPLGLAAGFDKNARWYPALSCLGFSHIEVGPVTRLAQAGNERPRLFRLPRDRALVNRMGFNNDGADAIAAQLARHRQKNHASLLGINIGKSKIIPLPQAAEDYCASFEQLFPFADYFALNVSSPNTPGLRQLQDRQPLVKLLTAIGELNDQLACKHGCTRKPVLLKISPDLEDAQLADIVAIAREIKLDGLIATNTTVSMQSLWSLPRKLESVGPGGISGAPLTRVSRQVVARIFQLAQGQIPIIGVGGIMHGEDAWQMIRAGASLVQIYTGFVYGGPGIVHQINQYLASRLDEFRFDKLSHAVGTGSVP